MKLGEMGLGELGLGELGLGEMGLGEMGQNPCCRSTVRPSQGEGVSGRVLPWTLDAHSPHSWLCSSIISRLAKRRFQHNRLLALLN